MVARQNASDLSPPLVSVHLAHLVAIAATLDRSARRHPDLAFTQDGVVVAVDVFRQHGVLTLPLPSASQRGDWAVGAVDAVENTPMPDAEWVPVIDLLGLDTVAVLVGSAPGSVRRYVSGERVTPQAIAERLHLLTLVIADLIGSYNDYGVRRWFNRAREQLDGMSPADLLVGDWSPDDDGPRRVRDLSASLVGLGAT